MVPLCHDISDDIKKCKNIINAFTILASSRLPQGWAHRIPRDYRGQMTEDIRWQEEGIIWLTFTFLHLARNLSKSLSPLRSRYSSEEVRKQELLIDWREVECCSVQ